jgi:hypothetical protein
LFSQKHKNTKMQNLWSIGQICGVLAENDAFDGGHQQKIFTPQQAHGMGNFTAWRGRIFSLATQKNKAILDK